MSIKGLPVIKCTKCGKTTLLDEYELYGCQICGSKDHGIDYRSYKMRENLAPLEGYQKFVGIYSKTGFLHYKRNRRYALINNIECGEVFTNHAYIDNISPDSLETLKSIPPGTPIQFKARVHKYNERSSRWGLDRMTDVMVL